MRSATLAIARLSSARRGGVGVCSCLARPNDGSAAFPLAALAWCVAFPQRRLRGLPTPAPPSACALLASPLCRACPCACRGGRGLRCVRLRWFVLRVSQRILRERRGRRGRLVPPKTERGGFRPSKLGEKLPRSVFRAVPCGHFASLVRSTFGLRDFPPNRRVAAHLRRIPAGVAPYPAKSGHCRARSTGEPARVSPRAAVAFG